MKRRDFLRRFGTIPAATALGGVAANFVKPAGAEAAALKAFKLGAISDGLSEDFGEALRILRDNGLSWVEIRRIYGKYNTEATPTEIREVKEQLDKYQFKCSVVDTALYKCALPGTTPEAGTKDDYPYTQQMDLLKRAIERAHVWGTDKIRGFTFWRVKDPEKHFPRIAEELDKAGQVAKSEGARLVIENEGLCNASTGHELAAVLKLVRDANVGANWDDGNGLWHGERSYPEGYRALDKKRIWHMHIKGVACGSGFKDCHETLAGQGQNDVADQFRAILRDKYDGTMSLECEFQAPGLSHAETTKKSLQSLLETISKVA